MRRLEDNEAVDCFIIAEGCKTRQLYNGWLLERAADKLGYDVGEMKRFEQDANKLRPEELVDRATRPMGREERWVLAEKLRKSKQSKLDATCDVICSDAGVKRPSGMTVSTVTHEEMFDDPLDDVKYATKRWNGWRDHVSPGFTGDIDVIVDMEEVDDEDVTTKILNWLASTGAADLFNLVDTRTATFTWSGGGWTARPYDLDGNVMTGGVNHMSEAVGDDQ